MRDPEATPSTRVARRRALTAVAVGADEAHRQIERGSSIHLAHGALGKDAAQEERLVAVVVAEAGDDTVTADLLTQRAAIAEKTAWMLRASL